MDESAELGMRRGDVAGPAPAPRRRGLFASIRENPHQFLLVLIAAITLYVTYRIWKSRQAGGSSSGLVPVAGQGQPNWGSVLGSNGSVSGDNGGGSSSGGGNGFPFQLTLLPPLHESVYQNASNGGAAKSWFTSAGQTLAQIAALFHVSPTSVEYNSHNAMYHYNDNSVVPAGTDIWIPTSQIDPTLYQITYNNTLGSGGPLPGPRNPSDPLP